MPFLLIAYNNCTDNRELVEVDSDFPLQILVSGTRHVCQRSSRSFTFPNWNDRFSTRICLQLALSRVYFHKKIVVCLYVSTAITLLHLQLMDGARFFRIIHVIDEA